MKSSRPIFFCLVILLLVVSISDAASPRPSWAPHAMVSSAEPLATEAGLDVLKRGGNAVDAAAAVGFALGVTESYSSGIGGGCFVLIRMADGTCVAIDGRETAPARSTRLMYVTKDTTNESDLSTAGPLASGTPGEVAAFELAVRNYGKLPFAEVIEGAIALADTGFNVDMRYARALKGNAELLGRFDGTREIFFKNGKPLEFGDRLVQKDLAATLKRIQAEGAQGFYSGDIPRRVDEYMKAHGGILSAQDFAAYKPVVREPVRGDYRGYELLSMPPPSSGGIHIIQMLNLLESFDLKYMGAGSSEEIHVVAEAMQLAFADRAEFLGDPDFVTVPVEGLISKEYAADRRALIQRGMHARITAAGNPMAFAADTSSEPPVRHTTHYCVVDSFGNAVSVTATVNTPFGSGMIVPGTGFFLNNEMDDFVTWPGRPNFFGLVGNAANEIEPGKRPLSSMSPMILVKDNKPAMIIGSMGGPRIISSVLLTLINTLDFGMNIQEAMDAPRIHQQWVPDVLYMEPDHPFDVTAALRARGHNIKTQSRWAAVTAIASDSTYGGWWGASDSRVMGRAKGF